MDNYIAYVRKDTACHQNLCTEKQALLPADATREVELTDTDLEAIYGATDIQSGDSQSGSVQSGDLQGDDPQADLQSNLQGGLQEGLLSDQGLSVGTLFSF